MASSNATKVSLTENGLCFEGKLDHANVPALLERLNRLSSKPASGMVLDISNVSKLDSAGLALLLHWKNQNLKDNENILLSGINKQNAQLIEIMGLSDFFEMVQA